MKYYNLQTLLDECSKESIHIPGKIQSHGFLLAFNTENWTITHISGNVHEYCDFKPSDLLGKHLDEILGSIQFRFIKNIISLDKPESVNPLQITLLLSGSKKQYNGIIKPSSNGLFLIEFENNESEKHFKVSHINRLFDETLSKFLEAENLYGLCNSAAFLIKRITSYDRVMIYQFDKDWHGEVIAEASEKHLSPYLGLHFPSSDIPVQARKLYSINWTRIIPDINYKSVEIHAIDEYKDIDLDLTHSVLRSVSPFHIEYLNNMLVQASLSISILVKGKLWGLIACHNYNPKFVSYQFRNTCEFIGKIFSYHLNLLEQKLVQSKASFFNSIKSKLLNQFYKEQDLSEALLNGRVNLLSFLLSEGAAIYYNSKITTIGDAPNEESIRKIIEYFNTTDNSDYLFTNFTASLIPELREDKNVASGLAILRLSKKLNIFILLFRPEKIKTIQWGSDPNKKLSYHDGKIILSPSNSFNVWKENVYMQSEEWTSADTQLLQVFRKELVLAIHELDYRKETFLAPDETLELYKERNELLEEKTRSLQNKITELQNKQFTFLNQLTVKDEISRLKASFLTNISKRVFFQINELSESLNFLNLYEYNQDLAEIVNKLTNNVLEESSRIQEFAKLEYQFLLQKTKTVNLFTYVLETYNDFKKKSNYNIPNCINFIEPDDDYFIQIDEKIFSKFLFIVFLYFSRYPDHLSKINIKPGHGGVKDLEIVISTSAPVIKIQESQPNEFLNIVFNEIETEEKLLDYDLNLIFMHKLINLHNGILNVYNNYPDESMIKLSF